jgi:anti-sigma regulatory factor (Ser/Thr protein kinase)
VVEELVDNAIVHGTDDDDWFRSIDVSVSVNEGTVSLEIADDGPGVPNHDRKLLESSQIAEYDDPMSGFGLQTVRLLVEHYDGDISVTVDDGTTVTVTLLRATESGDPVSPYGVSRENVLIASGAAVVAATAMGLYFQASTGLLPVIGALYTVESPIVGWISHQFHSIVFGLLFVAGTKQPRFRGYECLKDHVLLGIGWGLFLGVFAAGFIMPGWLYLTGVEIPFPYFTIPGVIGHLIWGSVLGGLYYRFSQ